MPRDTEQTYEVEKVLDKKVYKNEIYYKLKWVDCDTPTWEPATDCSCDKLIDDFEKELRKSSRDEDEDEWEVEEILKKRVRNNETEYLLKWKNWNGDPTWVKANSCECVNLIAAFENPKLRKMWNFDGTNPKLWLGSETILRYMKRFAKRKGLNVNIIEFEPDIPPNEQAPKLEEGVNIGPLIYKNHWYLIIILINHICVTKKLLIADPLNTLIGVPNAKLHPVYMRMQQLFKGIPIKPILMTPMERSDVCAFYILAGYERALFLLQGKAKFVVSKIFFDPNRAELIRSRVLPEADGEISVSLPVNEQYPNGPRCEFCEKCFDSYSCGVDDHIVREHFRSLENTENEIEETKHARLKRQLSSGDLASASRRSPKKRTSR